MVVLKRNYKHKGGNVRNIHFPFDIEADTPTAVAREMVEELDLTDQDVSAIAEMIESEIRSCFPDWAPSDNILPSLYSTTEPQNESPSPSTTKSVTSPVFLSLERLPSGRIYWSDTPKTSISPLKTIHSDVSEESEESAEKTEDDYYYSRQKDDNLDIIVEKLEHIMVEQQKELEELKKQHGLVVSDILMKLPPETRQEVVSTCKVEISEVCICMDSDPSFQTKGKDEEDGELESRGENRDPGPVFRRNFKTGIEYTTRI